MLRLAVALAVWPGAALAHGSERLVILSLPTGWYMLGAAFVAALTAAAGLAAGRLPEFRSSAAGADGGLRILAMEAGSVFRSLREEDQEPGCVKKPCLINSGDV